MCVTVGTGGDVTAGVVVVIASEMLGVALPLALTEVSVIATAGSTLGPSACFTSFLLPLTPTKIPITMPTIAPATRITTSLCMPPDFSSTGRGRVSPDGRTRSFGGPQLGTDARWIVGGGRFGAGAINGRLSGRPTAAGGAHDIGATGGGGSASAECSDPSATRGAVTCEIPDVGVSIDGGRLGWLAGSRNAVPSTSRSPTDSALCVARASMVFRSSMRSENNSIICAWISAAPMRDFQIASSIACFISATVWNRSLGSGASARSATASSACGMSASYADGGVRSPWRICISVAATLSALNNRRRASDSHSTTPSENTSLRRSMTSFLICSGDMYPYLPLSSPSCVEVTRPWAFAIPKSTTFTAPLYWTTMFPGDTSRWTIPIGAPLKSGSSCA